MAAKSLPRQLEPAEELLMSLEHEHPQVVVGGLVEIGKMGEVGAKALDVVGRVLHLIEHENKDIQSAAVMTLGHMGSVGAQHAQVIVSKLQSEDQGIRCAAIQSIGNLGEYGKPYAGLVAACLEDSDVQVQSSACMSLGYLRDTSAVKAMVALLDSEDADVVTAACLGLSRMDSEPEAVGKLLTHENPRVRAPALAACANMTENLSFVPAAVDLLEDSDGYVRIKAADLICALGEKAAEYAPAIGKCLENEEPGVRAAAATALAAIGKTASSEAAALEKMLSDTSEDPATLVLAAAGVVPKAVPSLRKPACAAAVALGAMGMSAAKSAPAVAAGLNSVDYEVRMTCLEALCQFGQAGAKFESQIMDLLKDPMPMVIATACVALGELAKATSPSVDAASAVVECFTDKRPGVRAAAVSGLGKMGEEAHPHLEAFVKLFNDRSWSVRQSAIEAVTNSGEHGQMYASEVCRMMFDDFHLVRLTAVESLAKMGERGGAFREEVEMLQNDVFPEVQDAAARAIDQFANMAPPPLTICAVAANASEEKPVEELKITEISKEEEKEEVEEEAAAGEAVEEDEAAVPAEPPLPVGLIFPGQGSQYVKMLAEVKDIPAVKEMLEKATKILGYDLLNLCLKGPESKLELTKYCQPAMYVSSLAAVELLKRDKPEMVERPQGVAGLSLGEYTALTVAGVFDFETGLKLVKLRGEVMQAAAEATPQMMLSIAGLGRETLEQLCKESKAPGKNEVCQIANILFPNGFSCAGSKKSMEALLVKAQKTTGCLQAKAMKTSGAFHTSLMDSARSQLEKALGEAESSMKSPRCTVYMNVTGDKIEPGCPVADIMQLLAEQLTQPVLWQTCMESMLRDGITEYYECGPMKQLKAMMKRINNDAWKTTTNIHV